MNGVEHSRRSGFGLWFEGVAVGLIEALEMREYPWRISKRVRVVAFGQLGETK